MSPLCPSQVTYSRFGHRWTFDFGYPRPLFPKLWTAVLTLPYQVFIEAQGHRQVKAVRNSSQHRVTVNKISPLSFTLPSQFRSNLLYSTHAAESTEFTRCALLTSLGPVHCHTHTQPHQNIELRRRHASQTALRARRAHTRKHTLPHFIRWPRRCEGQPKEREIEKSIQIYTGISLGKEVWNIK